MGLTQSPVHYNNTQDPRLKFKVLPPRLARQQQQHRANALRKYTPITDQHRTCPISVLKCRRRRVARLLEESDSIGCVARADCERLRRHLHRYWYCIGIMFMNGVVGVDLRKSQREGPCKV